ncbi:MAG: hypothetical protein QOG97_717 [Acidimicrobiaceae bacterium]|jgi:hypothetical protein|nr:hypothetical protein [Acidimicrobiaceae bacterium]
METGQYAGLRDRDYFHIMLNLDSFEDFLPVARSLAEGYLDAARKLQADPNLESDLRPFRYTKEAFETRLDDIYQGLVEDVTHYEAAKSWTMRTRDDVVEWILQMAPFNQTDGAWLRTIAPVGPIDEVRALLFGIYVDEMGGHDPDLNHPNIYTELMASVDIELGDLRSREYSDNPALLDSAFTVPLFQLVVSQFPQDFFPELLGMTQYLEWSSVELKNMVRLNEHFGLDPHFYEMHVAIDNAATGHGAMARRAVELYLEGVRLEAGDEAMQEQWGRVWNGYVAFSTTGTLAQEMAKRNRRRPTPAEAVAAMVRDRAAKARLNHGTKRLAGTPLNDLFADPPKLMESLVQGGMIVPGDPDASAFFDLLTADGPMYRIFTDADIEVWKAWARSLAAGPAPDAGGPQPPASVAQQMARLVDTMRPRQEGTPAHGGEELTGPDPADSPDPPGQVTKPVAWWFTQPTTALLAALANKDNGWVMPGDAEASPFVTDLLRGRNAMSRALNAKAPDGSGSTWADIAVAWINEGCPQPEEAPVARPLTLLSPPERVAAHPTGQIHGTGSVH